MSEVRKGRSSYPVQSEAHPGEFFEKQRRQKETSITSHVVLMGTVTMAFAELERVAELLTRAVDGSNPADDAIVREFGEAVADLR
jgi:hypothetical protein